MSSIPPVLHTHTHKPIYIYIYTNIYIIIYLFIATVSGQSEIMNSEIDIFILWLVPIMSELTVNSDSCYVGRPSVLAVSPLD